MARVYLGRLHGWAGFSRVVAIKRLHAHLGSNPEFVAMLLDEGRLTSHIRHSHVVPTLDVVNANGELLVVMEYVLGVALDRLLRRLRDRELRMPIRMTAAIVCGALRGLHAAHEASDAQGKPLGIVHRDVSPSNILVGDDGLAKVIDFGIAQAEARLQTTQIGQVKGKPSYMAPEQLSPGERIDRRADVYAAGVILWEMIAGRKLHEDATLRGALARGATDLPKASTEGACTEARLLDEVIARSLSLSPDVRYGTALDFAEAIENAVTPASAPEVGAYLKECAGDLLEQQRALMRVVESEANANAVEPTAVATVDASQRAVPHRSRTGWAAIGASSLAIAVAIVFALGLAGRRPTTPVAPVVAAAGPPPWISESPAEPASVPFAASGLAVAATVPTSVAQPAMSRSRPAAHRPPSARDCSVPFTMDESGTKIPKRECL